MSVREIVKAVQRDLRVEELSPEKARVLLTQLTSLIGNCNEEIRIADAEYAAVLLTHLGGEEAANRAKIRAETTTEFARKREARDTKELVVEMVRSLKYFLKSLSDEMQLAR